MASYLEELPVELTEAIVICLDLPDICALRSTCRSLAAKASHGQFRSHLRTKTIILTPLSVQKAREALQNTTLSRSLQSLTIVGVIPSPETAQSSGDRTVVAKQLGHAFSSLKAGSDHGRLQSLRLDVLASPDFESRPEEKKQRACLDTGIATVEATVAALQQSGLCIERLDIFSTSSVLPRQHWPIRSGVRPRPRRLFGLPISHIRLWTQAQGLRDCLHNVKQLSLSLSRHLTLNEGEDTAYDSALGKRNFTALSDFFQMMPVIENLDLHWFDRKEREAHTEVDKQEARFFNICHEAIPARKLKKLALRGLHISTSPLLTFLTRSSARNITLHYIRFDGDCCQAILDTLTRSEDSFEYFHLNDLIEHDGGLGLVHYRGPGEQKIPMPNLVDGPSEIIREGGEVHKKLERNFFSRQFPSNPWYYLWRENIVEMFGSEW